MSAEFRRRDGDCKKVECAFEGRVFQCEEVKHIISIIISMSPIIMFCCVSGQSDCSDARARASWSTTRSRVKDRREKTHRYRGPYTPLHTCAVQSSELHLHAGC